MIDHKSKFGAATIATGVTSTRVLFDFQTITKPRVFPSIVTPTGGAIVAWALSDIDTEGFTISFGTAMPAGYSVVYQAVTGL